MKSANSHQAARFARLEQPLLSGQAAREALRSGVATMTSLLRPTLGPGAARTAISGNVRNAAPEIADSAGIIVRRTIEIEGPYPNIGAMLLRQLVWRMHESVGDGGATVAVVAAYLLDTTARYVETGGDAIAILRGIRKAADAALVSLRAAARPIELPADITKIVQSSLGDDETALLIGEALEQVGPHGALLLRNSPTGLTHCEYAAGAIWDSGSLSPYFLVGGDRAQLDDPYILITDIDVNLKDGLVILETALTAGVQCLVIVAPQLSHQAIALFVTNQEKGVIPFFVAVKGPSSHGHELRSLEELALITGARFITGARGDQLHTLSATDFGQARQVWATKTTVGILGGHGSHAAIRSRFDEVARELVTATNGDERQTIRKRLGRLSSVTATLRAGGLNERDQDANRLLMEAGVAAGRAALLSGAVPGGGCALLDAGRTIYEMGLTGDEAVGARLFARSLEEPFRTIVANAGLSAPLLARAAHDQARTETFDVISGNWVDPWVAGIIDPLLIPERVVELSASFLTTVLRTDTLIHKAPKDF